MSRAAAPAAPASPADMLDMALIYARQGFRVVPLHTPRRAPTGEIIGCDCGGPRCDGDPESNSWGKHPRIGAWQRDATTDPAIIRGWWAKWPQAQIGLACGADSGAWVLDIDGEAGEQSLQQIEAEHGPLPATRTIRTGSGGRQMYWRYPVGRKIGQRGGIHHTGSHIDVRGEGGQVVAPPSWNRRGAYTVADDDEIVDAPEWLLKLCEPRDTVAPEQRGTWKAPPVGAEADVAAKRLWAYLQRGCSELAAQQQGGRNETLNRLSHRAAGLLAATPVLNVSEVQDMILSAAIAAGLSPGEARGTLNSGWRSGDAKPWTLPDRDAPKGRGRPRVARDNLGDAVSDIGMSDMPEPPPFDDADAPAEPRTAPRADTRTGAPRAVAPRRAKKAPPRPDSAPEGAKPPPGTNARPGASGGPRAVPPDGPPEPPPPADPDRGGPVGGDGRPTVVLTTDGLKNWQRSVKVLLPTEGEDPPLYRQGIRLVRVERATVVDASKDTISALLTKRAKWARLKWSKEDGDFVEEPIGVIPRDIPANIHSVPHNFSDLRGITRCPYLTGSGQVVSRVGYCDESQMFLSDAVQVEDGAHWTKESVLNFWKEWLGDFPFVGKADWAHALALHLLPFVRSSIQGPTPLHMIEAAAPRTGKSKLAGTLLMPAEGRPPPLEILSPEDEEVRKKISSLLMQGASVVLFDNVKHRIDCPALEAVLTASDWQDRILGTMTQVSAPNNAVWVVTVNNAEVSTDLVGRTIRCRLDRGVERPGEFTDFRIPDIEGWTRANRPRILSAALWVVQQWHLAGRPAGKAVLGSFEGWSRTIGGILEWLGVPGFLSDRDDLYRRADPTSEEWRGLVVRWLLRHGASGVRASVIARMAEEADLLGSEMKGHNDKARETAFGRSLRRMTDRIFRVRAEDFADAPDGVTPPGAGSYRITSRTAHGSQEYALVKIGIM